MSLPTVWHALWGTYSVCIAIALVLLMRSRANQLPLSLGLEAVAAASFEARHAGERAHLAETDEVD